MSTHYALLHEIPGQAREVVRLHGPDTERFVQGTITADLAPTGGGRAVAGALLTVKGKLVSELIVLSTDSDALDLLVPADVAEQVATLLDKHIIMDEVEVERRGPANAALLWTDQGQGPPVAQADGLASYPTRHPAPGTLVLGTQEAVAAAVAGAQRADADGFDRWRVQSASPAWGREIEAGRFPPEVGFVYAVSYDKGCYMGQEPLARIHARGKVNWAMARVEAAKKPRLPVDLSDAERPVVGRLTTAVQSEGKMIGLAIIRRSLAEPGRRLQTASDEPIEVIVTSDALGDDPGMQGDIASRKTMKIR